MVYPHVYIKLYFKKQKTLATPVACPQVFFPLKKTCFFTKTATYPKIPQSHVQHNNKKSKHEYNVID